MLKIAWNVSKKNFFFEKFFSPRGPQESASGLRKIFDQKIFQKIFRPKVFKIAWNVPKNFFLEKKIFPLEALKNRPPDLEHFSIEDFFKNFDFTTGISIWRWKFRFYDGKISIFTTGVSKSNQIWRWKFGFYDGNFDFMVEISIL